MAIKKEILTIYMKIQTFLTNKILHFFISFWQSLKITSMCLMETESDHWNWCSCWAAIWWKPDTNLLKQKHCKFVQRE